MLEQPQAQHSSAEAEKDMQAITPVAYGFQISLWRLDADRHAPLDHGGHCSCMKSSLKSYVSGTASHCHHRAAGKLLA